MSDPGLAVLLIVLIIVSVLTLLELVDGSHGSSVYRGRSHRSGPGQPLQRKPSSMRRAA